jgi:hypothetical protein
VQGLTAGMTDAELKLMHNHQAYNEFVSDARVRPDILTGHKSEQLAVYVLSNREIMHDTQNVEGRLAHMMSLTKNKVRNVPVPMEKIVDYDL